MGMRWAHICQGPWTGSSASVNEGVASSGQGGRRPAAAPGRAHLKVNDWSALLFYFDFE